MYPLKGFNRCKNIDNMLLYKEKRKGIDTNRNRLVPFVHAYLHQYLEVLVQVHELALVHPSY